MVAIGSPARTTAPRVTGTVSTRPSPGASTSPSALCCTIDRALRLGGGELVAGDVDRGAQLIERLRGRRRRAATSGSPRVELGLGVVELRLQRRIWASSGGDLEGDLVVDAPWR